MEKRDKLKDKYIAIRLLKKGIPIEDVSEATELPKEEIEKLI